MEKIKVLFICHGNICRSTMSQFVFQDKINSSPLATTVSLVNRSSVVIPAVILSILYPLLLNNPATRLNNPALLFTNNENTCFLITSLYFLIFKKQSAFCFYILSTRNLFVNTFSKCHFNFLLRCNALCQIIQINPPFHLFFQLFFCELFF